MSAVLKGIHWGISVGTLFALVVLIIEHNALNRLVVSLAELVLAAHQGIGI